MIYLYTIHAFNNIIKVLADTNIQKFYFNPLMYHRVEVFIKVNEAGILSTLFLFQYWSIIVLKINMIRRSHLFCESNLALISYMIFVQKIVETSIQNFVK